MIDDLPEGQTQYEGSIGQSVSTAGLERTFLATKLDHPDLAGGIVWTPDELRWINERLMLAILAEREACAKICEDAGVARIATLHDWTRLIGDELAAAIRVRSND